MLFKSILFFSFIQLFSYSLIFPSIDYENGDINKKDNKGRKQGFWIYLGKDMPNLGYPFEGKVEEGNYKDDRKYGLWIKYHKDGVTPKLRGNYSNNRPNGEFTKNYSSGKIREQGTVYRNKYKDSLKRFYNNGRVEYSANYNEYGREEGQVKYLYPNGQLKFIYDAQNGIPVGKASRFYENGDIKEIIYYSVDGDVEKSEFRKMVNSRVKIVDKNFPKEYPPKVNSPRTKGSMFQSNGYNKVYNSNDEIWQDGEFRNNRLWDGKVYEYDSDGILLKVKVFKEGLYHSDGQL